MLNSCQELPVTVNIPKMVYNLTQMTTAKRYSTTTKETSFKIEIKVQRQLFKTKSNTFGRLVTKKNYKSHVELQQFYSRTAICLVILRNPFIKRRLA